MLPGIPSSMSARGKATTLLSGLQVYYALEGLTDSTNGALTLTNNGTVTFGAGKVNNAATFVSASSQYLSRADTTAFQMGTGDFSTSAWIKFTTTNTTKYIIGYGDIGKGYGFATGSSTAGTLQIYIGDIITQKNVSTTSTWNDGNWHLVVCTYSRSGSETLYVDNQGSQASTSITAASGTVNNSNGFNIGAITATRFIDGSVDEFGLWNRVLTSAEITSLWNGGTGVTYPFV